jgi:hypothetical protein
MIDYSDNVIGKINGGGIEINLFAARDNVYLRKEINLTQAPGFTTEKMQ